MTPPLLGILGFFVAMALTLVGVPVAIAMAVTGVAGFAILNGTGGAIYVLGSAPFEAVFPYSLSVIPLFVAMGVFSAHAGLSTSLFSAMNMVFKRFRGGLAMATVGACAIFGAICGSSLATAATMGRIAVPEMIREGYSPSLAGASVAAAGTLGVLIPPSVLMVIYALLTENSIGQLFAAALLPGLLATGLYITAVAVTVRISPNAIKPVDHHGDDRPETGFDKSVIAAISLFVVVLGGLYSGLFSANEAAAVGAFGAVVLAILMKTSFASMVDAALETARTSAMIFMILVGAALFNFFIEGTGLAGILGNWISESGLPPTVIMIMILCFYLLLGCFMDSLSMILLTIPIVYPIVINLGFDPIWFGIIVVSVAEIGLITPPIGMNLFVVQNVAPQVSQSDIIRGILPFVIADVVRLFLFVAFPAIILFLPTLMR
ncbi:TRAP transporter large permease [Hoeflea ulvae]|uniref:TRAP transporter large permease protein n=1 Tax=Hoeflea ulvae TaxID=2983764 RepID=A0ABT3YLP1_9HYPH|nr:TRAP transporter large permease [Hoeflea ulvae]MCY0096747.1 TRAP transporter large permease [Hoeflea ulvae]